MADRALSRGEAIIGIATFFLLLIPISGLFQGLAVALQGNGWNDGIMWSVGISGILACLILRRPLTSIGWAWRAKYQWAAYLTPLAYALVSFGIAAAFGLIAYDPTTSQAYAENLGLHGLPNWQASLVFAVVCGTTFVPASIIAGLGEEIGWRGFLVPQLMTLLPFTATCLVTGILWGLWHFPLIFLGNYATGGPGVVDAILFLLSTTFISVPLIYLRLRANSVWPAALLHGTHNLFMRTIFGHMIVGGTSSKVVGEMGWLSVIVFGIVALMYWRKARSLTQAL